MESKEKKIMVISSFSSLLLSLSLCFVLLTGTQIVQASLSSHHHHHHHHHKHHHKNHHYLDNKHHNEGGVMSKLFVFGDSYADTGNNQKAMANSWKVPYGVTFPGKPSGRFSDGRVFPDYIASYMGIKSPLPYKWRNMGKNKLQYGMNFAFGGTGVFDTLVPEPNMTTQINFLKQLSIEGVYKASDFNSSIAYISVAGNDYSTYTAKNGSTQGLPAFIATVVNQLSLNLRELHSLGVKKVAISALPPLGCIPVTTATSSFQRCNGTTNTFVGFHNQLLQQMVEKLNNETNDSPFLIVDLYTAFMSVFKKKTGNFPDNSKFENPLKPCCMGISSAYNCGSVDGNGVKKYTVCDNPFYAFFWDTVHPTQQGWHAVYSTLQSSLRQLYL